MKDTGEPLNLALVKIQRQMYFASRGHLTLEGLSSLSALFFGRFILASDGCSRRTHTAGVRIERYVLVLGVQFLFLNVGSMVLFV